MSRRRKRRESLVPRMHARLAEAMAPLPDEFRWQPWGYLLDDEPTTEAEEEQMLAEAWQAANPPSLLDLRPDDTQFLPVIDFVLANEFPSHIPAQRTGAVL